MQVQAVISVFLSTPSARRATTNKGLEVVIREISIHALRKEGDDAVVDVYIGTVVISIHALREEGDRHHQRQRF